MNKLIPLFMILLVIGLSACGGGGGGSDSSQPGSDKWDSMVWDQDNWA